MQWDKTLRMFNKCDGVILCRLNLAINALQDLVIPMCLRSFELLVSIVDIPLVAFVVTH